MQRFNVALGKKNKRSAHNFFLGLATCFRKDYANFDFYTQFTGKTNPYQEVIEKYELPTKNKIIIEPDYEDEG